MDKQELIEAMKDETKKLNNLFELSAHYNIKFECSFDQSNSFGDGKVGYLTLRAFEEI